MAPIVAGFYCIHDFIGQLVFWNILKENNWSDYLRSICRTFNLYLLEKLTVNFESISALPTVSSGDVGPDGDNENAADGTIANCVTFVVAGFGSDNNGDGTIRGANNNPGDGNTRDGTIATTVVGVALC